MAEEKQEKKIIIDEDWKVQAQKEKEVLKEQQQKEAEHTHEMPEADFMGLVSMLATQAFFALGLIRTEEQKDQHVEPDFVMAKFHIDMLGMLEEKTRGNLNDEEQQLLKSTLDQLRMLFVQLSNK